MILGDVICYDVIGDFMFRKNKFHNNEELLQEKEEYVSETTEENVPQTVEEYDDVEDEEYYDEQSDYDYIRERILYFVRKFVNVKIIATVLVVLIFVQSLTAIILSGVVLRSGSFVESEKSHKIIRKTLSTEEQLQWITLKAGDKYIENTDGEKLHAMELKNYSTSHSYIIMCHPFTAGAKDLAAHAYHFYDLGFNVLLPDAGGCGERKEKNVNMGWYDRHEILLWVDEIIKSDKEAKIFLFGLGMGGSTVLMASSLDLPENVKGIISDSAYSDVHELFKANIKELYSVPSFPVVNIASLYVDLTQGWSFKEASALEQVKNAKVPVLFIHGGDDNVVPVSQSNDLYEACGAKGSDHLLISGASHCKSLEANEEKYWLNVDSFILDNI